MLRPLSRSTPASFLVRLAVLVPDTTPLMVRELVPPTVRPWMPLKEFSPSAKLLASSSELAWVFRVAPLTVTSPLPKTKLLFTDSTPPVRPALLVGPVSSAPFTVQVPLVTCRLSKLI